MIRKKEGLAFKYKSQLDSLIPLFHAKVEERSQEERARLVEEERSYEKLLEGLGRERKRLED